MTLQRHNQPAPRGSCRSRRDQQPHGFTLLETMVVITLLAVLAGAVFLTPTRWFRSAGTRNAVAQLTMMDRLARRQAVRLNRPVDLTIDLNRGTVTRADRQQPANRSGRTRLSGGVTVTRVLTASKPPVSYGKATIPCSNLGHTPTYALALREPDQTQHWVLVAGLTGQTVVFDNEKEINELLQQLVP